MAEYYKACDGWFNYYVNKRTGEKVIDITNSDTIVEHNQEDFYREDER